MERKYYKLVAGDTLYSIARANKCNVQELIKWNGIKDPSSLKVGQTIMVGFYEERDTKPKPLPDLYWPTTPWAKYNNNAGQFLDNAYYKIIGAVHPGNDINGNGGGDSDKGDPVYSISDGYVVDNLEYLVWGQMFAIDHPEREIESVYAHLNDVEPFTIGQFIAGGTRIGTIGKGAGNRYIAHLHFEIRKRPKGTKRLPTPYWPSTHYPNKAAAEAMVRANYYDAVLYLKERGAKNVEISGKKLS